MTTALKEQKTEVPILYKGYTIEPSLSYFGGYEYFPTEQGRDDDAEVIDGVWRYCGNVKHTSTIEEAKDSISEKVMMEQPAHLVETRGKFQIGGEWQINITKFWWFEDAVKFAVKFNGRLMKPITDI